MKNLSVACEFPVEKEISTTQSGLAIATTADLEETADSSSRIETARSAIRSAAWSSAAGWAGSVVSFFGNIVLARLLLPEAFGVVALATVLAEFIFILSGLSFNLGVIQCREELSDLEDTALWLTVGLCLVLLGVCGAAAVALRPVYGSQIAFLLLFIGVVRTTAYISYCFSATLERAINYRPVAAINFASTVAAYGAAILLALVGWQVMALAMREAAMGAVGLVGFWWVSPHRWRARFNLKTARWLWSYGWRMLLSRIAEVVFWRFDNFAVGTLRGAVALGFYNQAYTLGMVSNRFTQSVVQPVTFSTFAALQKDREALSSSFEAVSFWLIRVSVLMFVLTAGWGDLLVTMLYGEKWREAGVLFRAMTVLVAFFPIHESVRSLLSAAGHLGTAVRIRLLQVACFIPLVWWQAVTRGALGVAWAVNFCVVLGLALMLWKAHFVLSVNWRRVAAWPALCGGIAIAAALGLRNGLELAPIYIQVFVGAAVVTALYSILLFAFERKVVTSEFNRLWSRVRPARFGN